MSITTVADIKLHSNIATDDDDALIQSKIDAAESWIGKFIGTPLEELDPLPEPIREATRQLVAYWYEQREAVLIGVTPEEVPFGVVDLVNPFREWVF